MKLKDLIEGEVYECVLSGNKMLVVSTKKTIEGEGKKPSTTTDIKAGKYIIEQNGTKTFVYDELYNGQLKEIKTK